MKWPKLVRRLRGAAAMRLGRISTTRPLSADFGFSRGTPIDRYYIEQFLQAHSADIRGDTLEVGDDSYSRRFGRDRIGRQDVLHVDPRYAGATIVGDLATSGTLPALTFDCIILTQTLQLIMDVEAAVRHLRGALKPGGILFVTVPGVSSVDRSEWGGRWCWSMTEYALRTMLENAFGTNDVRTKTYGNLFAATAFLHGASVEDTGTTRLNPVDAAYPVLVAGRARAAST